ncbi:type II secretion system protein [bacterium]|nr:type II secretion system protein [bacterium]
MSNIKKNGFTLAEILITLTVIGIIAAITIPYMILETRKKETITALKKSYSTLQNAIYITQSKQGNISEWDIPETNNTARALAFFNSIKNQLNIMKVCGTESGCFADTTYKYLNGEDWSNIDNRDDLYKFMLSNGMSIAIKFYETTSVNSQGFFVDINGAKEPNIRGIDEFAFLIDVKNNRVVPYGNDKESLEILSDCSKNGYGNYCAEYILRYDKMDYL